MKIKHLLLLFLAVTLLSCSSGKKAYEHGNYFDAVILSVKRLRQKPDHDKSRETLKNSYPLAVEYLEGQANNEIASNSQSKWKNVIQFYSRINQMYEEIRQCPACLTIIKMPKNYYADMGLLKEKAADESYNAGINALMKGNRNDAKEAYYNFQDAQGYVPGFKDVVEYLKKAKDVATLKVVVEQIPVPLRYSLSGDFFQDKVEEFLHNNYTERSFIRFYTAREAGAVGLDNPDQILRIQFDDFSVGNIALKEKEETLTRDSVVVGEAKVNGKNIPVYNTVKAKLTTYRKEVISMGLLSMVAVDAKSNSILTHRKFEGNYVWANTWAKFNGDERALTKEQLNWCKQREQIPPPAQDLFLQFTKPIYDQLTGAVRGFYQNY
jgi:hypothetical protein